MEEGEKERLLKGYIIGVCHPGASGFEVLELLDLRSKLAELETELTGEEREKLEEADSLFLQNADRFYESLLQVADLVEMRRRAGIVPSHWWWYLDKLLQAEKTLARGKVG
jgi:hypothetical protein